MILEMWPTQEELGDYYIIWLKQAVAWVIVTEFCQNEPWYLDLERMAKRRSTQRDGIRDMVAFFEVFYHGIAMYDWRVHCIIRNAMFLF
jgi:hypothetical protein